MRLGEGEVHIRPSHPQGRIRLLESMLGLHRGGFLPRQLDAGLARAVAGVGTNRLTQHDVIALVRKQAVRFFAETPFLYQVVDDDGADHTNADDGQYELQRGHHLLLLSSRGETAASPPDDFPASDSIT